MEPLAISIPLFSLGGPRGGGGGVSNISLTKLNNASRSLEKRQ